MFRHFHLNHLKKHWIFPLIAGFLLVFLLLVVVNIKAIGLIKSDKIQESEKTIETVRRSIDHYLFTMQGTAAELMLNNENLVLHSADSKEEFTNSSAYKYGELMRNIKIANALIEDVYVYYPLQDYIVGTEGSYPAKSYFLLSSQLCQKGCETWKQTVLESKETEFFFAKNEAGNEQLYFRQQMPVGKAGLPKSVLVIEVNGEEFVRLLDMTLPHDGSTSIAVFTEDNQLYQMGTDSNLPEKKEISPLFEEADSGMRKIENNTYIGWSAASEYGGFRYVVISNKAALISRIIPIQYFLIAGIVICTLLGLLLSLYLGRKQQRTIEQTIYNLNEKVLWSMKESALAEILNQRIEDSGTINNLLQSGGIAQDYMYFRFILVDISFEKNKRTVKEWIICTGKDLEEEWGCVDVIPAVFGETAVFLINYDTCETDLKEKLKEKLQEICGREVKSRYSEEFMSAEQIVSIYEQTVIWWKHKEKGEDVTFSRGRAGNLLFERWKKALTFREYGNAAEMIKELFEVYVCTPEDSYLRMSRQYAVVNGVLQCIGEEEQKHREILYIEELRKLKKCAGVNETADCLKNVLECMEQMNGQYTSSQKDKLAHRIKRIIEGNYNQHYLGLCYISEQVNVSTSYVSKVFKEEYGIGVVEYMNRLRIDKAKKIMGTEELTVKEIAEKVGFTSDIHFIRIFKKYENTTPGVYQKRTK